TRRAANLVDGFAAHSTNTLAFLADHLELPTRLFLRSVAAFQLSMRVGADFGNDGVDTLEQHFAGRGLGHFALKADGESDLLERTLVALLHANRTVNKFVNQGGQHKPS